MSAEVLAAHRSFLFLEAVEDEVAVDMFGDELVGPVDFFGVTGNHRSGILLLLKKDAAFREIIARF